VIKFGKVTDTLLIYLPNLLVYRDLWSEVSVTFRNKGKTDHYLILAAEVFVVGKSTQTARSIHAITITSEKIYEEILPPFVLRGKALLFSIGISTEP
jgi:hypothetical protein